MDPAAGNRLPLVQLPEGDMIKDKLESALEGLNRGIFGLKVWLFSLLEERMICTGA